MFEDLGPVFPYCLRRQLQAVHLVVSELRSLLSGRLFWPSGRPFSPPGCPHFYHRLGPASDQQNCPRMPVWRQPQAPSPCRGRLDVNSDIGRSKSDCPKPLVCSCAREHGLGTPVSCNVLADDFGFDERVEDDLRNSRSDRSESVSAGGRFVSPAKNVQSFDCVRGKPSQDCLYRVHGRRCENAPITGNESRLVSAQLQAGQEGLKHSRDRRASPIASPKTVLAIQCGEYL
jgi:hypothetical protein